MPKFKSSVTANKVRRARLVPIRHTNTNFRAMAEAAANWSDDEKTRLGTIKEGDAEMSDGDVHQELTELRRETRLYRAELSSELIENGEVIGLPAESSTARGPWPGPPSPTSSDIFGPSAAPSSPPHRTPSPWPDENTAPEPAPVTEPTVLHEDDEPLTLDCIVVKPLPGEGEEDDEFEEDELDEDEPEKDKPEEKEPSKVDAIVVESLHPEEEVPLTLDTLIVATLPGANEPLRLETVVVASQPLLTDEIGPIGGAVGAVGAVGSAANPETTDFSIFHGMYYDPMGPLDDNIYLGHPDITDLCMDSEFEAMMDQIPLLPIEYPIVDQIPPAPQAVVVEDTSTRDLFVWHPPRSMSGSQAPLQPEQISAEPRSPYMPNINWDFARGHRASAGPLHGRQIRGFSPPRVASANETSSPEKRRRTTNTPEPVADPYDFKIWEDPEDWDHLDPSWGANGTLGDDGS